jgi:hypothetical protein
MDDHPISTEDISYRKYVSVLDTKMAYADVGNGDPWEKVRPRRHRDHCGSPPLTGGEMSRLLGSSSMMAAESSIAATPYNMGSGGISVASIGRLIWLSCRSMALS